MRWDVFISYASEDRETVAVPLARALQARGLRVWVDAHELRIGDSLRASIDQGLVDSRFGVVVLSWAFFRKRWPTWELNGLIAVESAGRRVVLPVWHGISQNDLMARSPLLADRLAGDTADGIEQVADDIAAVVLAEGSGTPLADNPTVTRLLLNVLDRDDPRAVADFLAAHPSVMRRAFGILGTEVRREVKIGRLTVDLCVGEYMHSWERWRWRGLVFGPPSAHPVDANNTVTKLASDLAIPMIRFRALPRVIDEEPLPDLDPAEFRLTAVVGRRRMLTREHSAAIRAFNNGGHGVTLHTYDWLADAASGPV